MNKIKKSIIASIILAGFIGCGTNSSNDSKVSQDYKENRSGVISADRLASYINDWKKNKPKGMDGRLIVVQAGATSSGKFLKHNDDDVVVYQIPAGGACDPSYNRHDGISNIPGALLSGEYADGMISTFNMNPEKDFVIFAVGEGSTGMREIVRSWWVMTYWGWPQDRLAFLDGSVSYTFKDLSENLVSTPTTPPVEMNATTGQPIMYKGNMVPKAPFYSMKSLNNVQTDLQIYIKDMMDIAGKDDKSGYFIADARGTKEYSATKNSRTADKNCGPNNDEQCLSPIQGHIRGAVDFPYSDLLVMDDQKEDLNGDGKIDKKDASYKFKSPAQLKEIYAEKGYKDGDKVITYCRTGRKATLLTLTAYSVLKYPVAMYDGSWIQWGEMANREDVNGTTILTEDSPLRTDIAKYTEIVKFIDPQYTQSSAPYKIDINATNSQKIVDEDKTYIQNSN